MEKVKAIKPGEIRVIKIGEEAIKELIVEFVMEHGETMFDLPKEDEESIFGIYFSAEDQTVTMMASRIADQSRVDLEKIAGEEKHMADSVYRTSPYDNPPYVTRKL